MRTRPKTASHAVGHQEKVNGELPEIKTAGPEGTEKTLEHERLAVGLMEAMETRALGERAMRADEDLLRGLCNRITDSGAKLRLLERVNQLKVPEEGVRITRIILESIRLGEYPRDERSALMGRVMRIAWQDGDNTYFDDFLPRYLDANSGPIIPGTMLCKATLDPSFPADHRMLRKAANERVIDHLGGEEYRIPMRIPGIVSDTKHGRSDHTRTSPSYVFWGIGTWDTDDVLTAHHKGGNEVAFVNLKTSKYDEHKFHGGGTASQAADRVRAARALRKAYRRLAEVDPAIAEAREYGADIDLLIEPCAVFQMDEIPRLARRAGRELGLDTISQSAGMRLAGIPLRLAREQRVLMYRTPVPKRTEELADISNGISGWEDFFGYYGYTLKERENQTPLVFDSAGKAVRYETAARKVLYGAAARYAVLLHIVHHFLEGACNIEANNAGVFQQYSHNINPLSAFDYDTIWWRTKRAGFGLDYDDAIGEPIKHYQETDVSDAMDKLFELTRLLKLTGNDELIDNDGKRAEAIFDRIYERGEKFIAAGHL